jgi:hypothetical protein
MAMERKCPKLVVTLPKFQSGTAGLSDSLTRHVQPAIDTVCSSQPGSPDLPLGNSGRNPKDFFLLDTILPSSILVTDDRQYAECKLAIIEFSNPQRVTSALQAQEVWQ